MQIKRIRTGPIGTNTYLFDCGGCFAAVDPGADARKILFVANRSKKPIRFVLLTHAHWDHVGAVKELQKVGATVYIHETDASLLQSNFKPDILVKDGDILKLSDTTVMVLHTPGHTAGSVCYLTGDTLFSGDTLFRLEIGRCDLPTGDFSTMKQSLAKLFALPKTCRVLPGHGAETELFFERDTNPYRPA